MQRAAVVIGAGATGRGHVAQLAAESGYSLVFLDKDQALCSALRQARSYSVRLVSASSRTVAVSDFQVFHTSEMETFYGAFQDASVVFTAVCPGNLKEAAAEMRGPFVRWLGERGAGFKNVLCCENMNHSSTTFREYLMEGLPARLVAQADARIGFCDTMVARVVAKPSHPLELLGEEYSEWTADRTALRGPEAPSVRTLEFVDDQARYLQRKLYIHNTGHATIGYLGSLRKYTYIHEAARDPEIMAVCEKAIEESGWAIEREYGFTADVIRRYRSALTEKCVSSDLPDEILRVVREPERKLGMEERFLGPAALMLKHGRSPELLLYGACAALLFAKKPARSLPEIAGGPVPEEILSRVESLLPVVQERFGRPA